MRRKIIRIGNSLGVTLPPELLQRWGLSRGSEVNIELDEECQWVLLSPAKSEITIDPEFDARLQGFIERYRTALESLAKR